MENKNKELKDEDTDRQTKTVILNYTNSSPLPTVPLTIISDRLCPDSLVRTQIPLIISRSSLDCTVVFVVHFLYFLFYAKHFLTEMEADGLHYMQNGWESGKEMVIVKIIAVWRIASVTNPTKKSPH